MKISKKVQESKIAREELYKRLEEEGVNLSDTVKLIRKIYGMTQAQYAKKVGVATYTVMNLERGKGNPTLKNIEKMLKPMKLTLKVAEK